MLVYEQTRTAQKNDLLLYQLFLSIVYIFPGFSWKFHPFDAAAIANFSLLIPKFAAMPWLSRNDREMNSIMASSAGNGAIEILSAPSRETLSHPIRNGRRPMSIPN